MKKYTRATLEKAGYEIKNAKITSVSLNMENHGCLTLDIVLEGNGWGVCVGGYCLGKGYVGADEDFFKGSDSGMEAIMRIMDVVGVSDLQKMKGEYVRVATAGWGSCVKIIGNIVDEKWFDYESFFDDKKGEKHG
jgi:hypothetical protein|nr:MAG TPA: hypothetical protein [Caudoviricetes sp.]